MENVLKEYIIKMENLLCYIRKLQEINKLVQANSSEKIAIKVQELNSAPSKRVFDYNLVIITIYGILEGFIEQIVKTYIEQLSKYIEKYDDLPDEIRKNHVLFSADLIKNCSKLSKYSHISEQRIVVNLYNCISGNKDFVLNSEAFTNHTSNFRKDTIRNIFKNIGIDNITCGICKIANFKQYFIDYEGLEEKDLQSYFEDSFYVILDELIERRNAIAHGNDVDDILSLNILENYIFYIKGLIESIFIICQKNLNTILFCKGKKVMLGKPLAVYDNSIICIYSQNNVIKVGMLMYAQNVISGEVRYGKIISMENDRKRLESVEEEQNIPLGIKVDFYAKNGWEYGILKNI